MNRLEAYLLGESEPTLELLRAARLEGWAYANLPEDHPLRSALRPAFLAATGRHSLIKNHLTRLLERWHAVGIEALLVKGFAVSEFAYSSPGQRFYGDVDILVRPERAAEATRIAKQLGWLEIWNRDEAFQAYSHEFSHLFSPDRAARIDLHLEFLQAAHPHPRRLELVRALWEASSTQSLGGVPVRVLTPLDALLLMLLNRRWGDWWARKFSDYPDALTLVARGAFIREDLLARARDLGCEDTIAFALESCDPWRKKLNLQTPRRLERWRRDYAVRNELGFYALDYYWRRALEASSRLSGILEALPVLLRAKRMIRAAPPLETLVSAFSPPSAPNAKPSIRQRDAIALGVRWCLWLFGPRVDPCVPRSLVLLELLSRAGFAVRFRSGVRRNGGKLEGHAWVEVDDFPLEVFGDDISPQSFKENYRFENALQRQRTARAEARKSSDLEPLNAQR
jgi:Uncharacterised nucleotidyltransferase/Transglutaminase-like superfamily